MSAGPAVLKDARPTDPAASPVVPTPTLHRRARWGRWALGGAAAAVLAGVFMLYAQPGFLVMLVDQLWSCF